METGVWHEWSGVGIPIFRAVPKATRVLIRRRDGQEKRGWADEYDWSHDGSDSDIVGYIDLTP